MAPSKKKHARSEPCVIPGGFTELSLQFSSDSVSQHKLYVKEHRVRAEKSSRPLDRTLFVLNIPPYCSKPVARELFSQFGSVQYVELCDQPGSSQQTGPGSSQQTGPGSSQQTGPGSSQQTEPKVSTLFKPAEKQGFKVGYIVFENAASIKAAKSHPRDVPLVVSSEQRPVETGIQKWIQQYRKSFVSPDKIQKVVDSFMDDYDKRKEMEAEQQRMEAEQQQEDEEGWVKVTRGNKGAKARPYTEAANERALQKENKKRRRKELLNFYTWQHRKTQREHIAELRKKFEDDKQRITLLRAQRKFKPY